ncbi:branched-chain amino acid ABC transporter permease [Rhabdaerophilum sp. SD176]|uniref:branched-chain amino acid ABC transporter permease n=1 Tax=Rhabdaerophilum sp. SD176 TaxID=2983548 RepID=UPI0024DF42C3|nr:branched-chain amino acid ABC transporter permease [Rhabdaerophilum sp. SD176]
MQGTPTEIATRHLAETSRWKPMEFVFWLVAFGAIWLLPSHHLILNEIIITALFAMSLDLILGYAGIASLGHAAFFGFGAYFAGIFAIRVIGDPLTGLVLATLASGALGFITSFLVLRGVDLARLMVTLGVALVLGEIANKMTWLTGGADGLQGVVMGPVLGLFEFDLYGRTAYVYSLVITFLLFLMARRIVVSPFGLSLRTIRDNPLRARAIGIPVNRRLIAVYTLAAAYAGAAGALLAQTTQFVSLDVIALHRSADVLLMLVIGGTGYLYGGFAGAIVFKVLQDVISNWTPQYWTFWIGLILVILVLIGRERMNHRAAVLWARLRGKPEPRPRTIVGGH